MSDAAPVVLYFLALAYLLLIPVVVVVSVIVAAWILLPVRRAGRRAR